MQANETHNSNYSAARRSQHILHHVNHHHPSLKAHCYATLLPKFPCPPLPPYSLSAGDAEPASPSTDEGKKRSMEHKAEGARLFKSKEFGMARAEFVAGALALLDDRIIKLLCNRAACHLSDGASEAAVLDASAVLCLAPSCERLRSKAHFRRVTALLEIGALAAAGPAVQPPKVEMSRK